MYFSIFRQLKSRHSAPATPLSAVSGTFTREKHMRSWIYGVLAPKRIIQKKQKIQLAIWIIFFLLRRDQILALQRILFFLEYNTNFNKEYIIDKAFQRAFKILISKITVSKDYKQIENQNLKLIKSFVESFSVVSEKFENNKYFGVFEIDFNKNKILSFLRNNNIFHSRMIEKKVLTISYKIPSNHP